MDHSNIENWLLIPESNLIEATRLFIEIGFRIIKCENILTETKLLSCKETLKLYVTFLKENENLPQDWFNYTKWFYFFKYKSNYFFFNRELVDTYFAISGNPINQERTSSIYVASNTRVYFALKNTGACSALLYCKVKK